MIARTVALGMCWPRGERDLQVGMTGLLEEYNVLLNGERQRFQTVLHCHVVAPRPGRLLCMCNHVVDGARLARTIDSISA